MSVEDLDAYRKQVDNDLADIASDDFLVREGLSLLSSFRAIKSEVARQAVLALVSSIVEAERAAENAR